MMSAVLNVPGEKGAFDLYAGSQSIARDEQLHEHSEYLGAASPDQTPEPESADTPRPEAQHSPHSQTQTQTQTDTVMDRDGYGRRQSGREDEEGVEVVLAEEGDPSESGAHASSSAATAQRPTPDQNVFRPPRTVKPHPVRAPGGPPHRYMPSPSASGSYSYAAPPSRAPPPTAPPEHGAPPYPVPYNPSRSFEESSHRPPHPDHYSPHVQYPPAPVRGATEDVNVISPSHRSEHGYRPSSTASQRGRPSPPRPASYYQYPPPSPVSRPESGRASSPPRLRGYSSRGRDQGGPYPAGARGPRRSEDDRSWNPYPATATATATPSQESGQPPVVATSFDSEAYSSRHSRSTHPATPGTPYTHAGTPSHDPHHRGYGSTSYGTSFDSQTPPHPHGQPPPPHFDDSRYYGRPSSHPPESPYSHYSYGYSGSYSYGDYSPHPDYHRSGPRAYSKDDSESRGYYHGGYPPHPSYPPHPGMHAPPSGGRKSSNSSSSSSSMLLPEAAREIDFDVTSPPSSPITKPSDGAVCKSPGEVNGNDVLCGRGGGTNSQIGNRMFRKLVQEFQPTYLLARRKEKPLLARTIVLIIRKRGGRFLKKNEETGELYEVGDQKAEAKTSQALREGLDVRATRSAAGGLLDRKKKKAASKAAKEERAAAAERHERYDASVKAEPTTSEVTPARAESPPSLPRLQGEERPAGYSASRPIVGEVHPPSPEALTFRKRRRMRSGDNSSSGFLTGFNDKLFPDFCPPRADLARGSAALADDSSVTDMGGGTRSSGRVRLGNPKSDDQDDGVVDQEAEDDDIRFQKESTKATGCAGIALDIVTGAARGSFCLGPR